MDFTEVTSVADGAFHAAAVSIALIAGGVAVVVSLMVGFDMVLDMILDRRERD